MVFKKNDKKLNIFSRIFITTVLFATTFSSVLVAQEQHFTFSGGPKGGTFQFFSGGIATLMSKYIAHTQVVSQPSAGSVENLRRVNAGEADFGIVYSGDLYLGSNGQLENDTNRYRNAQVVAYMYGAPSHLLVREDSGIQDVTHLIGKRVAVGAAGSGAAATARRFFESLGLWNRIQPHYVGYVEGASALKGRQVDALWIVSTFPNATVSDVASSTKIRLLDLYEASKKGVLNTEHPYYIPVKIPGGTYVGIPGDVMTFQDSALWVAGRHVSAEVVYEAIGHVYAEYGLRFMHATTPSATTMSIPTALTGVVTTIHRGAQKYWTEKGLNTLFANGNFTGSF